MALPSDATAVQGSTLAEKTVLGETALIEDHLNWLERIEVGSRVGAGILTLTYVSGYLIATTHLGKFGIPADASEFLRAKYIYIGFQYWMFVTIIAVLARVVAVILDAMKVDEDITDDERVEVIKALEARDSKFEVRRRDLRRWLVLALVLLVFSFEIMFLNPNDVRKYLSLQSLLLLSIALYQLTFYREYSSDGYTWGLLYAKRYVHVIRWVFGVGTGVVSAVLMVGTALAPYAQRDYDSWAFMVLLRYCVRPGYWLISWIQSTVWFWVFGSIVILALSFAALFMTLSTDDLKWLDVHGKAQKSKQAIPVILFVCDFLGLIRYAFKTFFIRGSECGMSVSPSWQVNAPRPAGGVKKRNWVSAIDCFIFPPFIAWYCWLTLRLLRNDDSVIGARVVSFGVLVLALIVLANVSVILAMRRDLHKALKYNSHNSSVQQSGLLRHANTWSARIVMFALLYIVSLLGFAYRIYPFIPVQKAGGNYSTAEAVSVHLSQATGECSAPDLEQQISPGLPYIVLDEDSNWVYLAQQADADGPNCWSWGVFCHANSRVGTALSFKPFKPKVFTINRHCIASIQSMGENQAASGI